MTVFIVVGEDRHSGLTVHQVCLEKAIAIADARAMAEEYAAYNDQPDVKISRRPDEPYHGEYSCEGDYVAVIEKEVK